MVDFCFAAADSQNVWESVPFLAVWQGRHSSNRPTTTDDGHHCRGSAQSWACSRWVSTSCSSSSYWAPAFAESSVLMMRFLQQNTHIHTEHRFEKLEVALEIFLEFFPASRRWSWNFLRRFSCFKKLVWNFS